MHTETDLNVTPQQTRVTEKEQNGSQTRVPKKEEIVFRVRWDVPDIVHGHIRATDGREGYVHPRWLWRRVEMVWNMRQCECCPFCRQFGVGSS